MTCVQSSSGEYMPKVFGWTLGRWYDSSEFSMITFQLQAKSRCHEQARRYWPPNESAPRPWIGPRNSSRLGPSSASETKTSAPQVATRNRVRQEFSRSKG